MRDNNDIKAIGAVILALIVIIASLAIGTLVIAFNAIVG